MHNNRRWYPRKQAEETAVLHEAPPEDLRSDCVKLAEKRGFVSLPKLHNGDSDQYVIEKGRWRIMTWYEMFKLERFLNEWLNADPARQGAYINFVQSASINEFGAGQVDAEYYRNVNFRLTARMEFYRIENDPIYQTKIIKPIVSNSDIKSLKEQCIEVIKDSLHLN